MFDYIIGLILDFIDKTIIKIGAGTSAGLGVWSKVSNIDWMSVMAVIIGFLTIISLLVRIWSDYRSEMRKTEESKRHG